MGVLWLVRDWTTLLALFFALLAVNSLGGGVAGLSFMDVVGKVIPLEPIPFERVSVSSQIQRARRLPRQNHAYSRFLGARLLMVVADMAVPFYVVFARESLSAPPGLVGVYLLMTTFSALLTNLWAGRVSDLYGNRRLLLAACLVGLVAPGLALLFSWWRGPALLFAVVFALSGAYSTASWMAHTNFLLEIAPAGDRPIYVGTANTLVGTAILASSGGGALVDWLFLPFLPFALK